MSWLLIKTNISVYGCYISSYNIIICVQLSKPVWFEYSRFNDHVIRSWTHRDLVTSLRPTTQNYSDKSGDQWLEISCFLWKKLHKNYAFENRQHVRTVLYLNKPFSTLYGKI